MAEGLGSLDGGGRVVIIGGGPGGTACGLALQRLANQIGRQVDITVLEGKQFSEEHHYNQCVGVLSPPLPTLLNDHLDLQFPHHLSRREINGYVLHVGSEKIILDDNLQPSVSLRRIQFDDYMLKAVKDRGVRVITGRAVDLEFHTDRVVIYTENAPLEADVVVGAFGLDEGSAAMFARLSAYRPPEALSSVVTKYHPGAEGMSAIGQQIHAFLPRHPRIEFGAITPKGNHLTINIAGQSVDASLMQTFLDHPHVSVILPNLESARHYDPDDLRIFKGRFPRSLAHHYYGNRYVMVGDAAGLVRSFKGKGVTSAVLTGIRAAETIIHAGVSAQAFDDHYRTANQDIIQDLPFGRWMRLMTIFAARFGLLSPVIRAAKREPKLGEALFDAVSAHGPYRQVLARMLRPDTILAILRSLF